MKKIHVLSIKKGGMHMRLQTEKIKLLHTKRGMNQGELAEEAGISRQGLNAILARGTCHPKNLLKIATALNVDPQDLVKEA